MKKYSKDLDNKIEVKSAGIRLDVLKPYVAQKVIELMKKRGIIMKDTKSRVFDKFMVDWADKIVIVADNVDPKDFPKMKTEVWKIEDASEHDEIKTERIIGEIEEKVRRLANSIGYHAGQ